MKNNKVEKSTGIIVGMILLLLALIMAFFVVTSLMFQASAATVDDTAPVGTVTNSSGKIIENGGYTNKPIKYSATDESGISYYQVKNPKASSWSSYVEGTALSSNIGWYAFRAVDNDGNISDLYRVYYDSINPSAMLYADTELVSSGVYTNADSIMYLAMDSHSGVKSCYVKKPGSGSYIDYTSGSQLTGEGTYYFYCSDNAGNTSSTVSITLDRTAPTTALYGGTTLRASDTYTNADYVKFEASDRISGVDKLYVRMPNDSYYTEYLSGAQLTTEGIYYFYAVDKAGNSSSAMKITLDNTKPIGIVYGGMAVIASGGYTNANNIIFKPSDNMELGVTYVKKPGAEFYEVYSLGTQLTEEGIYSFYCTDMAWNTSEIYTVTVDRQIPSAQLYVDGRTISSGYYTNGNYVKFVCDGECFVKLPASSTFSSYGSGTELSKPGKYIFYGVDEAGNSTGNYTVIIDRTQKTVNLSGVVDNNTNGNVTITWDNGNVDIYAPIFLVTVNGNPISSGTTVYTIDTGKYNISVMDMAGNVWSTEFISTKTTVMTDTLQKTYYEIADNDGNMFAFSSYEKALEFAICREKSLVICGTWNSEIWDIGIAMDEKDSPNAIHGEYYIYKKSGSPTERVAYFTTERLNEVISEYIGDTIKYYYWQKAPATAAEGENLYSYSDSKTILANKVEFGTDVGLLLDGEEFVGNIIETEGKHTVTVFDEFGNTCDYTVIIIRNAPSIQYAIGEGSVNDVSYDRTYFFKDEVTVSITDELDEMAMFRIYRVIDEEETELVAITSLGESFTLTASGTYTVVAVNHAGDSQTFNLVISRSAPSVTLADDADNKQLVIKVTPSEDAESHIQTLIIQKSTDGGKTWVTLDTDDFGTAVEFDTLTYKFRTSGIYKVTITDEFRTGIDSIVSEKNYTQPAPTGELEGVENGGHTNTAVEFSWEDDAIVTVTKDGEKIEYMSGRKLTEDGEYTIVFENHDGHKTTYTFTIDTKAPAIAVDGAKAEGATNTNVSVNFDEDGLTAIIEKDGTEVNDYASGTVISEDGKYVVTVTDKAGNEAKTSFEIDKTVGYDVNINDGGLANSVTIYEKENLEFVVTKNGTSIEYKEGTAITEPATYAVKLLDTLGNKAEFSFTVVEPIVGKFEEEIDLIAGFEKVLVNGTETTIEKGTLALTESGVYEVSIVAGGKTHKFTVTVDATAPTLVLNGATNGGATTNPVTLTDVSEEAEVKVFKGEEEIEYTVGNEISDIGSYKVVVTDACGNSTEYNFEIEKGDNIALVVILVVLGVCSIAIGVFFFIRKRNRI